MCLFSTEFVILIEMLIIIIIIRRLTQYISIAQSK